MKRALAAAIGQTVGFALAMALLYGLEALIDPQGGPLHELARFLSKASS